MDFNLCIKSLKSGLDVFHPELVVFASRDTIVGDVLRLLFDFADFALEPGQLVVARLVVVEVILGDSESAL